MRVFLASLILSPVVTSSVAGAVRFDPPNLELELELHRQFKKGQGLLESPALTKDSYLESYKIRSGETLWSLSRTLYGDGHFWPRVWAQNQGITNPHLIRPGHTLQFLMGSEDATPSFRFTEEDDGAGGIELAANTSNQNPLIEIPPPEIPPKPVLNVPASFPEWQQVFRRPPVNVDDDRGLLKERPKIPEKIFLSAYVQEQPPTPSGWFLETDLESALPVVNQYVYVKLNKGSGSTGQKMIIIRSAGKLKRLHNRVDFDAEAYLVQIAGEVKLTELVPAGNLNAKIAGDYDVYRALITKATSLSTKELALIPGEIQTITLSPSGTPGTANAQIIGSAKHEASALYGPGDIVFLNKGSTSGIEVDQLLDVFVDRVIRKDTPVHLSPAPSGTVKIVKVSDSLSTAVVLVTHDGIMQGDRVQQITSRRNEREELELENVSRDRDEGELESDLESDDEEYEELDDLDAEEEF